MEKRKLLVGLLGLMAIPFAAKASNNADAATSRNKATWTVPRGIDKIRIRSTAPDGSTIFSRELDVEPGQTFYVEAI